MAAASMAKRRRSAINAGDKDAELRLASGVAVVDEVAGALEDEPLERVENSSIHSFSRGVFVRGESVGVPCSSLACLRAGRLT